MCNCVRQYVYAPEMGGFVMGTWALIHPGIMGVLFANL